MCRGILLTKAQLFDGLYTTNAVDKRRKRVYSKNYRHFQELFDKHFSENPLSDADIFKAKIYNQLAPDAKKAFIERLYKPELLDTLLFKKKGWI